MRTFRIFPWSVYARNDSRATFKAGRARSGPRAVDIFDKKFASLKAAIEAATNSTIPDLVVCKKKTTKMGKYIWMLCFIS